MLGSIKNGLMKPDEYTYLITVRYAARQSTDTIANILKESKLLLRVGYHDIQITWQRKLRGVERWKCIARDHTHKPT
jgi:hypothetical protein